MNACKPPPGNHSGSSTNVPVDYRGSLSKKTVTIGDKPAIAKFDDDGSAKNSAVLSDVNPTD